MYFYKDLEDKTEKSLFAFFAMSFGGHLFVVLFFVLFSWLWQKSDPIDLKKLKIIQSSVKVDIVGMPKYTLKELQKMQSDPTGETKGSEQEPIVEKKAPVAKPEVKAEEQNVFKEKQKKINLNEMLKNLSKKEVSKSKPKAGAVGDGEPSMDSSKIRKLLIAGNKLSKGVALTGDVTAEDLSEFEKYSENLPSFIRPYWKIPSYLKDQEYKCRIRVYIGRDGQLIKTQMYESSGSEEYDQLALLSIKRASPLPPPPEKLVARFIRGEIILGFPL